MGHEDLVRTKINCHILTVSSSRTGETDESGDLIERLLDNDGHVVSGRDVVPDAPDRIMARIDDAVSSEIRVLIITGGTGLSLRDQTVDVLARIEDRELPGFGELFRGLSYEEIGPRAMLSRAKASLVEDTLVFSLPGSPAAVRLGLEKLVLPVMGHAIYEIDKEDG